MEILGPDDKAKPPQGEQHYIPDHIELEGELTRQVGGICFAAVEQLPLSMVVGVLETVKHRLFVAASQVIDRDDHRPG